MKIASGSAFAGRRRGQPRRIRKLMQGSHCRAAGASGPRRAGEGAVRTPLRARRGAGRTLVCAPCDRSGFTLVEVMVAIGAAGILIGLLATIFQMATQAMTVQKGN